jgi:hypothetical protein
MGAGLKAVPTNAQALTNYRGTLYCEENRALILLGAMPLRSAMDSLPPGTSGFVGNPIYANKCTLADGREVRAKIFENRPMGTGECGNNSDGWASLWVDRKRVLSRHAFFSECWQSSGNILLLEGDQLTACVSRTNATLARDSGIEAGRCDDLSDQLTAAVFDPAEYGDIADNKLPFGTVRISYAEDPSFCAHFLSRDPAPMPYREEIVEANLLGPISDPRLFQQGVGPIEIEQDYIHAIAEMDDQPTFVPLGESLDHATGQAISHLNRYGVAGFGFENLESFDFDNDGADDIVIRQRDRTHYFWGDRYFVLPKAKGIAALKALNTYANANHRSERHDVDAAVARIFAGIEDDRPEGDVRYRLQTVFRFQGQTLVFVARFNGYLGAIVYRPRPGGVEEPVCVFERRPENW